MTMHAYNVGFKSEEHIWANVFAPTKRAARRFLRSEMKKHYARYDEDPIDDFRVMVEESFDFGEWWELDLEITPFPKGDALAETVTETRAMTNAERRDLFFTWEDISNCNVCGKSETVANPLPANWKLCLVCHCCGACEGTDPLTGQPFTEAHARKLDSRSERAA